MSETGALRSAVAGLSLLGAGAHGPMGRDARETVLLLRAGLPAVGPAPFSDGTGAPITMGVAPGLGTLEARARVVELGARAVRSCVADLERSTGATRRLGLWLALSPAEVVATSDAANVGQAIARAAGLERDAQVVAFTEGAMVGADALRLAAEALRRGEVDVALVGGAHSDHDGTRVRALVESGRLYTNDHIEGSFAGEQAACVAIGRPERARHRAPLASIVAAGAADAPEGPVDPERLAVWPELAQALLPSGLARGIGWVLSDAGFDPRTIREHGAFLTRRGGLFGVPYLLDYPAQRMGALGASATSFGLAVVGSTWSLGGGPSAAGKRAPAAVMSESDTGRRGLVVLEPG